MELPQNGPSCVSRATCMQLFILVFKGSPASESLRCNFLICEVKTVVILYRRQNFYPSQLFSGASLTKKMNKRKTVY